MLLSENTSKQNETYFRKEVKVKICKSNENLIFEKFVYVQNNFRGRRRDVRRLNCK